MNNKLLIPEVQEKRKKLATQVYTITRKAVDWGEENGYSALIRDIDIIFRMILTYSVELIINFYL